MFCNHLCIKPYIELKNFFTIWHDGNFSRIKIEFSAKNHVFQTRNSQKNQILLKHDRNRKCSILMKISERIRIKTKTAITRQSQEKIALKIA